MWETFIVTSGRRIAMSSDLWQSRVTLWRAVGARGCIRRITASGVAGLHSYPLSTEDLRHSRDSNTAVMIPAHDIQHNFTCIETTVQCVHMITTSIFRGVIL